MAPSPKGVASCKALLGHIYAEFAKGGENIAPREVDEARCTRPDVVEAAVRVCEGSPLAAAQLIGICRARLGPFKSPDHVHFMAKLPKGHQASSNDRRSPPVSTPHRLRGKHRDRPSPDLNAGGGSFRW